MGEVIRPVFGTKRLGGFIPDEVGQMAEEELQRYEHERRLGLLAFARQGAPPILDDEPMGC